LSKIAATGKNLDSLWRGGVAAARGSALPGCAVKFVLVDQLLALEPGKRITMCKNVSMAEEYLADHFPGFPVLPGVMMLEAAVQASAWLVRHTLGFRHSVIVLKEARGVRYGTFVSPGQTLVVQAEAVEIGEGRSDFKIKGTVGGATAIQARLELAHMNAADADGALAGVDAISLAAQRERWEVLSRHSTLGMAAAHTHTPVAGSAGPPAVT
jgi:3-hydroxyacyl-[acyl-carrier-protein] dehydratase